MYNCSCPPEAGYLPEPYHIPGYSGHVPTMRYRNGGSFGRLAHEILEDPCVAQAPLPILKTPEMQCPPSMCRSPVGCEDLECCSPCYCPPPPPRAPKMKQVCEPFSLCLPENCDPRAHHLNRSPYACPSKPDPDTNIYRCCESLPSSYTGHVPGFTFHSNGRTFGKATWGTKQYMQNCLFYNTFAK